MKATSSKGQEGPKAPSVLQEEEKSRLLLPFSFLLRELNSKEPRIWQKVLESPYE